MKTLLTFIAVALLSGCAQLAQYVKPAADVGVAAIQFDSCRVEIENYLPDELLADLAPQFEQIETTVGSIVDAANGDLDVNFDTALRLANISQEADSVEKSFLKIADFTIAYASERPAPQALVDCDTQLRAGWKALRNNKASSTLRDFLTTAGPYIKTGAKLLPLLLEADHERTVYASL